MNKPYADWTYLIMKIQTNERTNEQKNKKVISLMFLCDKKTTKYVEKVQRKSAGTAISGIFPAFSARKKFFSKIRLAHVLSITKTHLQAKSQKKIMTKFRGNSKKLVFRHISGIFGRKKIFSKIGLSHILGIANTCLSAKNWEKQMMESQKSVSLIFQVLPLGITSVCKIS